MGPTMSRIWVVGAACLAVGFGAGWYVGPAPARRLCKECGEIATLQARPDRTAVDSLEADNLKAELVRKERGMREWHFQRGEPPDLHPDCECPCHRYWIGPESRVHDGA